MEDFNKAVAIRTRLVEQEGRTELRNDLAASLANRSIVLEGVGRFSEAVDDLDKVVAIRTDLVEQEGRQDLGNSLANGSLSSCCISSKT